MIGSRWTPGLKERIGGDMSDIVKFENLKNLIIQIREEPVPVIQPVLRMRRLPLLR